MLRSRLGAFAGTLLLLAWLPACSSGGPGSSSSAPAPTPVSSAAPASPSPSPQAAHTGALAGYLLPVPAGAKAARTFPTSRGTFTLPSDGRLTRATAIRLSINPHESQLLTSAVYKAGAIRAWSTASGRVVLVQLLQFVSAVKASAVFTQDTDTIRHQFRSEDRHPVEGWTDAVTLLVPSEDPYAHGIFRSYSYAEAGDIVVVVITSTRTYTTSPEEENDVLLQQARRL